MFLVFSNFFPVSPTLYETAGNQEIKINEQQLKIWQNKIEHVYHGRESNSKDGDGFYEYRTNDVKNYPLPPSEELAKLAKSLWQD